MILPKIILLVAFVLLVTICNGSEMSSKIQEQLEQLSGPSELSDPDLTPFIENELSEFKSKMISKLLESEGVGDDLVSSFLCKIQKLSQFTMQSFMF